MPGSILGTRVLRTEDPALYNRIKDSIPFGRLGTPEEVAHAVLMVLGNAYMTGQTVPVNGGLHFN